MSRRRLSKRTTSASTCGLNNFHPTTYDAPGRFAYVRIAWKD